MGNEGKGRGAGANLTIHSNSVTYVGLTTGERARAPCIDRCHASIVWLNFTRESGARSRPSNSSTHGAGDGSDLAVSDFQSRQWSLLFDDLASRSCPGSPFRKKGVSNRVASTRNTRRRHRSSILLAPPPRVSKFRFRLASISDIPFSLYSLSLPDTSRFLSTIFRHLLIVIHVYLSNRDL